MRVITGSARGCRLKELEGMETRPTMPDGISISEVRTIR